MTEIISAPATSTTPLRIALAGLGTVGAGVIRLLDTNRELITRRAGRPIEVVAISARDRSKDRGVDLSSYRWDDDMDDMASHGDVDAVVELIGGADGPALTLARNTLKLGKPFVTANKAMIAHHGMELAQSAEEAGVALKYEAAVAGGIPVIKGLREGAAANDISRVYGILNGTCNYILTTMEKEGRDFADVLKEAQAKGFAEADPTFDIDGIDAAHKLAILASLSFGTALDLASVETKGIRDVTAQDIEEADDLGYRIRLIGSAVGNGDGLLQRVAPMLIPLTHPLAHIDGPTNAVVAEGNFVGRLLFQGAGAGEGPTASAVVADLIDIARGEIGPAFAMPTVSLKGCAPADQGERVESYYARFGVVDRIGALAEITAAMRDANVSIESVTQRGHTNEGGVFVAVVTHETQAKCINDMVRRLSVSEMVTGAPLVMPLLEY